MPCKTTDSFVQQCLSRPILFDGVGLHGGQAVRMVIHPAPADHGIVFRRTDLAMGQGDIPALWHRVVRSPLCTLITNDHGASVSTIEHVMAALAGCAVHNALIEVDGPEVPILDGSAAPFVAAILRAGLVGQNRPVKVLRVLAPVEVREGAAVARLEPADMLEIDFRIDFADAAIGQQAKRLNMANGAFVRELSDSRTFCRNADVIAMRERGLALGGSLENAVVVDGARVLSPGGLRHADEPVRHKMLDALGDLALAGMPIIGRYIGERAGHAMTNRLLHVLFAQEGAWSIDPCHLPVGAKLPGVGVSMRDLLEVA